MCSASCQATWVGHEAVVSLTYDTVKTRINGPCAIIGRWSCLSWWGLAFCFSFFICLGGGLLVCFPLLFPRRKFGTTWHMVGLFEFLRYIHATHCYKYGSLRRVYRLASKTATLSLSLIGPITLRFNSDLFGVTSDTCYMRSVLSL